MSEVTKEDIQRMNEYLSRLNDTLTKLIDEFKKLPKTIGLTDKQLRDSAVPITGTIAVDTTGLATEVKQDDIITAIGAIPAGGDATSANQVLQTNLLTTIDSDTSNLDVALSTRLKAADTLAGVSDVRQAVAANLNMTEASASAIKTAVEIIDNFISGSRGLVTEDNSASIKSNTDSIVTPTAIYTGKTTVTTAGTRVALASSQVIKSVTIKALSTNTGLIYVGNSAVTSSNGFQLSKGDTVSLDLTNLATVYLDSSVNGEGVTYIANS